MSSVGGILKKLVRNGYNPFWWYDTVLSKTLDKSMRRYFSYDRQERYAIAEEDWDNLILLDACRYDMFAATHEFSGELDHRYSRGSATKTFLERNFCDREMYDTVYVTANPMYRRKHISVDLEQVFYRIVDVWENNWDDELNTVTPESMRTAATNAHQEYPNKRLLVHFVQPHHPFIGPIGQEIEDGGMQGVKMIKKNKEEFERTKKVWDRLEDGEISQEFVWEAYNENLKITYPHIEKLLDIFEGKTVITSDHGNHVGEFAWPFPVRLYGHPKGYFTETLTKVPWMEVDYHERKDVIAEKPVSEPANSGNETVTKRLEDLGYVI